jgi:hypothetical protein
MQPEGALLRVLIRHDPVQKEAVMSEDDKQKVDTDSAEFKQGVEAGLNSEEDTKNWKAGNELGQELKEEGEDEVGRQ